MTATTSFLSGTMLIDKITGSIRAYDNDPKLQNASYETGVLVYSIYYLSLSKYKSDPSWIELASQYCERGIGALDLKNFTRAYGTDSLDLHLAHIGRFLMFCERHKLMEVDAADYLNRLDDILFDLMKSKITVKDFDSGSGAMASVFYFLDRHKSGVAQEEKLTYLVNSVDNFALKDDDGNYYWKCPSLHNRVYLGISHGNALMMSVLSNIHELGICPELCSTVIEKASNFLVKQYRRTPYKGLFPTKIGDDVEPMQFALCYGDVGTGYALYRAAKVLNSQKIGTLAEMVLDDCLLRTKEDNLTLDAGIYYGASGLGIAFDKLATVTGDDRFVERANYWYSQIPEYSIYDDQFAGFRSRLSNDSIIWNVSEGWGIIGIGISLMCHEKRDLPSLAELTFIA
jgi:hypothetical protein